MTEPTDDELDAVIAEYRTRIYPQDMHPRFERAIMRAAIAKWGTPPAPTAVAGLGEVVAHRVVRKLNGEWASDARDWSDGPPSRALVDSIRADKGRWRIDVAYAAPAHTKKKAKNE